MKRFDPISLAPVIAAVLFGGGLVTAQEVKTSSDVLRVGIIGVDTSHAIQFTRRLNDPEDENYVPGATVVAAYCGGSPDIESSVSRLEEYTEQLRSKYGVRIYDTIEELCGNVAVVMLESLDGRPHLEQVKPVIAAGKTVFVDKPVAGSLKDACEIYRLAEEAGVPLFSASSLRWYPGVVEVAEADVGEVRGAISWGPASVEEHHPTLFWYGIHPTEALFTVLGPGCESVVATETASALVVTGRWKGGKVGTLHGIKDGKRGYKVVKFGTAGIVEQSTGGDYTPMIREMVEFFRSGEAPVEAKETLEIYAFMEAADESVRRGGARVTISEVMEAARGSDGGG
jgi:predicted dehydrogenase